MAKGMYASIGGTTKKIKKNYAVVGGVTKKIKKMYAVIDGKTRLIFSGDEGLVYHGTSQELSAANNNASGTSIADYALFSVKHSSFKGVDAYNKSLVKTPITVTHTDWSALYDTATSIGGCGLFAGGSYNGGSSSVYKVTSSLTYSSITKLSIGRYGLAATSVGDYAIFVGGQEEEYDDDDDEYKYYYHHNADAYNSSMTKAANIMSPLDDSCYCAATTVGNYAIFSTFGRTFTYDNTLSRSTATNLSAHGYTKYNAATSVGDYAIFVGGQYKQNNTISNTVEVYNSSLTKSTATNVSLARINMSATTLNGRAIFAGGASASGSTAEAYTIIDVYDASLTRSNTISLSIARDKASATSIGNYALIAGGYNNTDGYLYSVDVFKFE